MTKKAFIWLSSLFIAAGASAAILQEDSEFLRQHTDIVILRSPDGDGRAIIVPEWQGRVMTSSAKGTNGYSMGWVNRDFIAAGEPGKAISPYGGEDRFWLGPEAGPFALYFGEDEPFDMEHWRTPAPLDKEAYKVAKRYTSKVRLGHSFQVTSALDYVNSVWGEQDDPYAGDAFNSYNDGTPPGGGPQPGKFYELESSSPAAELEPGKSLTHTHRTFHFQGEEAALSSVAKRLLGVSIEDIRTAFD